MIVVSDTSPLNCTLEDLEADRKAHDACLRSRPDAGRFPAVRRYTSRLNSAEVVLMTTLELPSRIFEGAVDCEGRV